MSRVRLFFDGGLATIWGPVPPPRLQHETATAEQLGDTGFARLSRKTDVATESVRRCRPRCTTSPSYGIGTASSLGGAESASLHSTHLGEVQHRLVTPASGREVKYCDERVCLSVGWLVGCLFAYFRNHTSKLYKIFNRSMLGLPMHVARSLLAMLRYVMYFRVCGLRHICS